MSFGVTYNNPKKYAMGLAVGNAIGVPFGGKISWSQYWTLHNTLWTKGRSGLVLPDDFGNSPTILPSYFTCNGTDDIAKSLNINSASFVGHVSGTYCEAIIKVVNGEYNHFFSLSQAGHAYKRMIFQITNTGLLKYYIRDGTAERSITSTNALSVGWHTVRIESAGGAYHFYVDGTEVNVTVVTGFNDGQWNIKGVAPSIITIGGIVLSGGTSYYKANVANVKFGSTMQWICNNSSRIICLGFATTAAGDGQSLYSLGSQGTGTRKGYGSSDTYVLDKGYSIYKKAGSSDIEVPNLNDGSECDALITGYAEDSVVNGNLSYHNLADSKIRFTASFFDRSNATIWNAGCRASSYYDSTNTKDFHVSELNFKTLIGWLNVGYAGMFFLKYLNNSITDRQLLQELILFDIDMRRQYEVNALTYTGDIAEAVTDAFGNYLYDSDGYVLIS